MTLRDADGRTRTLYLLASSIHEGAQPPRALAEVVEEAERAGFRGWREIAGE